MNEDKKYLEDQINKRLIISFRFHTMDKIDLLNALKNEFGERVIEIVEKVEGERTEREWKKIAENSKNNTIDDLINLLWIPLKEKGFEFTHERINNGIQIKCTKCPIFDLARELKGEFWMFKHTCCSDPYIASGFNPQIKLRRTKTLMEGHDCCDHFYFMKKNDH